MEEVSMFKLLRKERWSPYATGAFIGILAVGSFLLFDKTMGTTAAFIKLAALFWSLVDQGHLQSNAYYQEFFRSRAWIDWQFMLVLGIFLGAYISRRLSRKGEVRSPVESAVQAPSTKRLIQAFIGGVIVMFGAPLAGGCTSGHAISGGFQLAVSGWLFMLGVFALGIPTAFVMYSRKRGTNS